MSGISHTNLIKLNGVVLCAKVAQESLGGLAVRAVGFAEDSYAILASLFGETEARLHTDTILFNDVLGLGLSGRHICRADRCRSEESA